jgi:hypothetical protein
MAHDHVHHHDPKTFYAEQIFTIIACAALALVTCLWWSKDQGGSSRGLMLFISQRYHPLVLAGGLGLFALVVVRSVAVWKSVDNGVTGNGHSHGEEHHHDHAHGNDHDHGHDHDHDHGDGHSHEHACGDGCEHEHEHNHGATAEHEHARDHDHAHHDHDHDHGWAPWRYVVLLIPVMLFLLGLPNDGFTGKDISKGLTGPTGEIADKGFAPTLGFKELEAAAQTPLSREENAGKTVRLIGKYMGDDDKRFSLSRFKMTCCSADAIPLNAVIMVDPKSKDILKWKKLRNKWVEVTGQLQFLSRPQANDADKLEYMPAVIIYPKPDKPLDELVKLIPAPSNPFLN